MVSDWIEELVAGVFDDGGPVGEDRLAAWVLLCGGCGKTVEHEKVVRCGECMAVMCADCRVRLEVCWYCGADGGGAEREA